jgi:hypothetical protein
MVTVPTHIELAQGVKGYVGKTGLLNTGMVASFVTSSPFLSAAAPAPGSVTQSLEGIAFKPVT